VVIEELKKDNFEKIHGQVLETLKGEPLITEN
jgi:hypothetical protein